MNWILPTSLATGTFIGVYLTVSSLSQSFFGALGAFVVGVLFSVIIKQKAK